MFCPRCGKPEQLPETYCRQCGLFLPDLLKPAKRELPPEDHLKANTVLSLLTIIASFTLSILLFAFFGFKSDTHPMISATAGVLIAIGGWHIQSFIRNQMLKRQWKRRARLTDVPAALHTVPPALHAAPTKLMDQPDSQDRVPASLTENTTLHLVDKPLQKPS